MAAVLVIVVGLLWMDRVVRNATAKSVRNDLQASLHANVAALEFWLQQKLNDSNRVRSSDDVGTLCRRILEAQADDTSSPAQRRTIEDDLQTLSSKVKQSSSQPLEWILADGRGVIVAAQPASVVGGKLELPTETKKRLISRESVVSPPVSISYASSDSPQADREDASDHPVVCALSPVVAGARTIGSFALVDHALAGFADVLSADRQGASGECYAFNRQGLMVSPSRFEPALRRAGLLSDDTATSSVLHVAVRDPGFNAMTTASPRTADRQSPLTYMADQATRGGSGVRVQPYANYLGVPVVGAWTWLADADLGVAVEMDYEEAFLPAVRLRRTMGLMLLLSMIGGSCLGILVWRKGGDHKGDTSDQPRQLGQYELGELIGRGAMGSVYRGRHQYLRRDVAIKVLETDDEIPAQSLVRFEREVQLTAKLRHPNTIDIYDYGRTDQGVFFYVMEYLEGMTLQDLVEQYGPMPPSRTIHVLCQLCGSLSEAHQLGMIHRDVKPSNIVLTARAGMYDMVKVLDFGLVKQIDRGETTVTPSADTRVDAITGTPMYMSPEAVRDAGASDQRSDLYSVGAVGYWLLTGKPPFEGNSAVDVCWKQLNEYPVRPSRRLGQDLPDDLQNLVMSCLRKSREDRPRSAADLADSLRACESADGWTTGDAMLWWEQQGSARPGPARVVEGDPIPSEPQESSETSVNHGRMSS